MLRCVADGVWLMAGLLGMAQMRPPGPATLYEHTVPYPGLPWSPGPRSCPSPSRSFFSRARMLLDSSSAGGGAGPDRREPGTPPPSTSLSSTPLAPKRRSSTSPDSTVTCIGVSVTIPRRSTSTRL